MLIVVMGLSGSGKSFVSSILHQDFGFEWLRSDVIRKELMGIDIKQSAKANFGEGIYSQEVTKRVYQELVNRAKKLTQEGKNVVLDATFLKEEQRQMVKKSFPDAIFLCAVASEEEIKRRLSKRVDVSDADFSIYLKQKETFSLPNYAIPIDTDVDRQELKERLEKILDLLSKN